MIGRTIAHYSITSKLGQGGMGEVYQATDTKLRREVALKILPPSFTDDPQRMARFTREAQVLASLSHPNIGAIHGLEEEDGVRALVLELIEGEDLSERIARGPIPLAEALQFALQIAEALEAAHEKGIIHRDLKPANVKITQEGQVKVLDFGLAKALEEERSPDEMADSPTLTMQATQAGVILGTAAYMSPEQAKGRTTDRRTDVWAFGAVLYEMLSGRKAFDGDDVSEVIAAVIMKPPSLDELPASVPFQIHELLDRCLRRDVKRRLRDIGDARIAIEDYLSDPMADTPESTDQIAGPAAFWQHPAAITTALIMLLIGIASGWYLKPLPETPLSRMLVTADGLTLYSSPTISPDGNILVYQAEGQLWLRHHDRLDAEPVDGSDGASFPFFSFDSAFLAYSQAAKLWKVNLTSGAKTSICDSPAGTVLGGTWSENGSIVLGSTDGLYEVSDQGGDPKLFLEPSRPAGELGLGWPHYLPHGKGLVFRVIHAGDEYIGLYANGERTTLLKQDGVAFESPTYSSTGHLLYDRRNSNEGLWAIPFDLSTLEIGGQPRLIDPSGSSPSVSDDGRRLSYLRGGTGQIEMVWVDRTGQVQETIGQPQVSLRQPALSPNGRSAAVAAFEKGNLDIWLHDVENGSKRTLSFLELDVFRPTWTADGDQVAFDTLTETGWEIWVGHADSTSGADKLTEGREPHFSSDGRYLVFVRETEETGRDLWYLDVDKGQEPKQFLATEYAEMRPRMSPDSRWIAYVSDHSGQNQIYVKKFPSGEGLWTISNERADHPRWSPDGDELFYAEGRDLSVVSVGGTNALDHGAPTRLFTGLSGQWREYAVADGGDRFIVTRPYASDGAEPSIAIVHNWSSEFPDRQ